MEKVAGAMVTFSLVIFSKQPMTETGSFFVKSFVSSPTSILVLFASRYQCHPPKIKILILPYLQTFNGTL